MSTEALLLGAVNNPCPKTKCSTVQTTPIQHFCSNNILCNLRKFKEKEKRGLLKFLFELKKKKERVKFTFNVNEVVMRCPAALRLHSAVTRTNITTFIVTADENDPHSNIFRSQAFQKMHTALVKQSISRQMQWNVLKELLFSSPDFNR